MKLIFIEQSWRFRSVKKNLDEIFGLYKKPVESIPDLFRVVPANDQPAITISRWWKINHHIEIHHDQ